MSSASLTSMRTAAVRWICPPDNLTPLGPTRVSRPPSISSRSVSKTACSTALFKSTESSDSPSKINLETDVQGYLQPGNLADLDASLILAGVLDVARIPKIDHIDDLLNQGILTHAQLDTFVQLLDNVGSRLMGEISTVNLLKLII